MSFKLSETKQNDLERERKSKAHLELNLLRKVKGNRKDFYRCISSNTQTGKNPMDLLMDGAGNLVTKGTGKAEVLSAFLSLVFTSNPASQRPLRAVRKHGETGTTYIAKD